MHGPATARRLWRDPLAHFFAGSALLFRLERGAAGGRDAGADAGRIVVSDAFVRGMRERARLLTGREPSGADVDALVREYVREEALYRAAAAAGLDRGDALVRRRLAQKMELLVAASVDVPAPDDAALAAWLASHGEALREPARVAFVQVFFARDRRGDGCLADARAARARVVEARDDDAAVALGDPFVAGHAFAPQSSQRVAATFGDAFAEALSALPEGAWSAPLASPFGAHLLRVTSRVAGRVPPLDEVREAVRRRWTDERREAATRAAIARIVAGYELVRARAPR